MRVIENQDFTAFYDDGGCLYEVLVFRKCKFISSAISIARDPANRSVVRNVTLERCRRQGSALHCAVIEDVLVDGLQTSDLHQAWGAVFKHVTLTGKIGRLMVTILISSDTLNMPLQRAFDRDREAYYADVDWALDISRAESVELQLRGIPASLIRRDPETQVAVTRKAAMAGEWRDLKSLQGTVYGFSLDRMLMQGAEDIVLVADKRAKDFKTSHKALQDLRAAGIAQPD